MNTTEVLREGEKSALNNNQIVSKVTGKKKKTGSGKIKGITAATFITVIIAVFAIFFSSGTLIPSAISERLIEETDTQYADAVESKKLVFQKAMKEGELPDNTTDILKQRGIDVGYVETNGEFKETNKSEYELVLKMDNRIITADNFINEVSNDARLYDAFNAATYSRAAYYYDDPAKEVFRKIGTNRNNYTADSDFEEVMSKVMGEGSDININSVSPTSDNDVNYYKENGESTSSNNDIWSFIEEVIRKNPATTSNESALNTADSLKVADTVAKEQRSSLFYTLFMENISKMKAGEGNESKINEAMNFLYEDTETEVVDIETGELITVKGTALDSPSLYAVLSGEKMKPEDSQNYSSDRVLKTVENSIGMSDLNTTKGTVASVDSGVKGAIGRLIKSGGETVSMSVLEKVEPTLYSSLVDNSYGTIKGVNAGEFLVEGAVNTGKMLAKTSGATVGDADSVAEYARLNSEILAMDAEVDRMNRSPFDVTSKNTFLGSILYKLAINNRFHGSNLLGRVSSVMSSTIQSIGSITTGVKAEGTEGFLSTYGDCETKAGIGAVGDSHCADITTFDTSTLNDTFNDAGFKAFVEKNTILDGDTRSVKEGSTLANFIIYNNERITPTGVVDGGILDSLSSGGYGSVSFITNILQMIESFLGTSESDKRIASGASFVNSVNNPDWGQYKYAQRYVSLARATAALRQYSGNSTAYNNIEFFEGKENPVVAFLDDYYQLGLNH